MNSVVMFVKPFDPYPYIFLNLILSCLAAMQAPVILMSQNRQEARDRIEAPCSKLQGISILKVRT